MNIILGSSSPKRKAILEGLGVPFRVMIPDIDEKAIRTDDLYALPLLIAQAKRDRLRPDISEAALLITADATVISGGMLFEKPETREELVSMFHTYCTYPAETVTALTLTDTLAGVTREGVDVARVFFRDIPEKLIEELALDRESYNRAGGFTLDDPRLVLAIERVEGERESVLGLPVSLLKKLAIELDFDIFQKMNE